MAQGNKGKNMASLPQKKDDIKKAHKAIMAQAEEFSSTMAEMVGRKGQRLREYMLQKKQELSSKVKAKIKLPNKGTKPKKRRRTTLSPILGAVLKFHKDDDVDPGTAGAVGVAK